MVILQMPPQCHILCEANFALCADGKKSAAVAAVDEGSSRRPAGYGSRRIERTETQTDKMRRMCV